MEVFYSSILSGFINFSFIRVFFVGVYQVFLYSSILMCVCFFVYFAGDLLRFPLFVYFIGVYSILICSPILVGLY